MSSEKLTSEQLKKRYEKRIESFRIEIFETLTPLLSIIIPKLGEVGFTMRNSLAETGIIEIAEKTVDKMGKRYFYKLEDDQLQYFLNIIITNLPGLIVGLDFEKEISQRDLDKLGKDKVLELETQEEIFKQVTHSISRIIVGFVNHRVVTIMGKKYTVAKEFPVGEGELIKDENGHLFWQPNISN